MASILRGSIVELLPDGLDVKAESHHGVVVEDPAPVEHERGFLHRRVDPRIVVPSGGSSVQPKFRPSLANFCTYRYVKKK